MAEDNVISLKKPESFVDDQITEILRNGARKLLAQALEAEIDQFTSQYKDLRDESGHQRIVRIMVPRLNVRYKPALDLYPSRPLVSGIGIMIPPSEFASNQTFCRRICVKQKAWNS